MRRVWAAVLSVWATISVVGVLAWTNAPSRPVTQPAPQTFVVQGKDGQQHLVVVSATAATAPHATTHTSPPPP